jgi:hypothetical protein
MTQPYDDDQMTRRIVTALDALPVPNEPTGFTATAKSSFVSEPRMIVVTALVLLLIATVTSPPFQRAAAELSRYIERIEFGRPRWVGYYLESANMGASDRNTRLRFASSDSQTHPSIVMIGGTTLSHGQWSPDGERITVSDGSQLYVGDRSGRVRPVTDLGAGRVVGQSGWIGNDKVWAVAPSPDFTAGLFVTVELKTGAIEQLPIELRGDLVVSPDGRWGAMNPHEGGCDTVATLFNFATHETLEVVDGRGRPASLSFVRDGRILVQQCDHVAGTVELYVGAPGDRPDLIAAVPITVRYPSVAYNDSTDEILVIASSPDAPQDAYVFDPTGHLLRTPHLPQFAREGQGFIATLSRDGRSLGFIANDLNGFSPGPRAGVIDLATGDVTYLCDAGCWYLLVR